MLLCPEVQHLTGGTCKQAMQRDLRRAAAIRRRCVVRLNEVPKDALQVDQTLDHRFVPADTVNPELVTTDQHTDVDR